MRMKLMIDTGNRQEKRTGRTPGARVVRRCPYCGRMLYEKLSKCDGEIQMKCPKCGKSVNMNLALRKAQG